LVFSVAWIAAFDYGLLTLDWQRRRVALAATKLFGQTREEKPTLLGCTSAAASEKCRLSARVKRQAETERFLPGRAFGAF
jgi:hypothetical protein